METIVYCSNCTWSGNEAMTKCIFDSLLQDYILVCPICGEDIIEESESEIEVFGSEYIEEEDY